MYRIKQSDLFVKWLIHLKDIKGKVAILRRIERARHGNFGDHKTVGGGVSELRITVGPAYRVYYTVKGDEIILLLIGGDKSSQHKDIQQARILLKEIEDEEPDNI